MKPNGYFKLSDHERIIICALRDSRYSLDQIAELTGRSRTTVKRVLKNR
jgi:IS30 family transposase